MGSRHATRFPCGQTSPYAILYESHIEGHYSCQVKDVLYHYRTICHGIKRRILGHEHRSKRNGEEVDCQNRKALLLPMIKYWTPQSPLFHLTQKPTHFPHHQDLPRTFPSSFFLLCKTLLPYQPCGRSLHAHPLQILSRNNF